MLKFTSWEHDHDTYHPEHLILAAPNKLKQDFLTRQEVDCIFVEGVLIQRVILWVKQTTNKPKVIILMMDVDTLVREEGPISKKDRKVILSMGYDLKYQVMAAHQSGASLYQSRLVVTMHSKTIRWTEEETKQDLPIRPMRNLLREYLIPKKAYSQAKTMTHSQKFTGLISNLKFSKEGNFIYDINGLMPDKLGTWIQTEKGIRRVSLEELARAKGVGLRPKEGQTTKTYRRFVRDVTCAHLWITVIDKTANSLERKSDYPRENELRQEDSMETALDEYIPEDEGWQPPDLSPGQPWHCERIHNLKKATAYFPKSIRARLIKEGEEALKVHRQNYSDEGPKRLQLLWWEFPKEHWNALISGSSMNFLIKPTGEMVPNSEMEEPDRKVAALYVDELKSLGVLQPAKGELLANCPLFCVDKPDGSKRCIADCKRGGQNACIGKEPVYLVQKNTILPQLYAGGYSAVADCSKQFHNFPTRQDEQCYLGCIHPITQEQLVWVGLPMGSSNSPSIACKITNSVLRQIKELDIQFSGKPINNTWQCAMDGKRVRPQLGYGRNICNKDDQPLAKLWSMVDDFFIHAATKRQCWQAFKAFLDHMVRVGFICQARKTHPPSQVQKFCGLLFDTTSIPTLRIPPEKISRCLATMTYIKQLDLEGKLSRLSLSILSGLLQSLVEATPSNLGQTHLRSLYDNIHHTSPLMGRNLYYSLVKLEDLSLVAIEWWEHFLKNEVWNTSRAGKMTHLSVNWGDGSGTGAGGTIEQVDPAGSVIQSFMGVWKPQVAHFDSNWKELRTVLTSLGYVAKHHRQKVHGGTVFYFTDNLVTYYVVNNGSSTSPALHSLVHKIKLLELSLQCNLEVIHVPGELMILQQSDGLSRGIPLNRDRLRRSTVLEARDVLKAVPYSRYLQKWALEQVGFHSTQACQHLADGITWGSSLILHQVSIWTPSPETARQAIDWFLTLWVESPYDTCCIMLVPRVLQRDWHFMSKHIQEIGVFLPLSLPTKVAYHSLIPFCLLYCPYYRSSLPSPEGMDSTTNPSRFQKWCDKQAEYVRRLQ